MRTVRLFLFIFLCLIAGHSFAQDYIYAIGNPAFAVDIPVENGFINITNGNLHMEFPLATHKQRGALQLNERLVYDSRIWRILPPGSNPYYGFFPSNIPNAPDLQGGWRLVTGAETGTLTYTLASPSTSYACAGGMGGAQTTTVYNVSWSDPSGTVRDFGSARAIIQDDCAGTYMDTIGPNYASDASGYLLKTDANGNPLILDNNGNQVYPKVIDRFGNYWSSDANGNLIDDVGRTPVIVTKNGSVTYYDVLAPNGPISNNGTRVRYTVTTSPLYVSTLFYQPAVSEWVGNFYPVQSIQLPDGSSYSFTYDSYGEMTSVTLPTGGVIHYGWTNFQDSYNNMNRWLTSRTVGSDPAMTFTPSVMTQCASNGTGCQEKVVVHKPSGDETAYEMTLNNGAWNTKVSVYTGAASGTPIATTTNGYSFQCSGCGSSYITQSSSVTTLAGGLQSQRQYVFDAPWLGKPSKLKEWDYYSGTPSTTPTRETDYSYSGVDLHQETVFGNGTQVAQTTYDYTTSATATSGVSQHGTTNAGGPYLQKVTKWLNGGTSPYTTYIMDDTGMVTSITDPNQNSATTISYQCSNSLPYQAINPIGHTTTFGYDCSSGAITSEKDPNDSAASRSGTTYAYESAGRLSSVTRPDSGVTTYSYPSSTEIDTTVTATPSPSISSQDIVDSLGRPYQHVQAGVSTETTYDVNGRPYCTTNPHLSSSSSTDGSTCITSYDGLDRPKMQSQSDGASSVSWDYSGNTVTFTDEAQHSWQRTSDVFGNLTFVVEPGGLKTSYQYNALGKLNCVDQWEANTVGTPCTSSRWRSFIYDSLSRLTQSYNPESGTICYGTWSGGSIGNGVCQGGYDANGNLKYKTDARGVVTSYSYDSLNRLTGKSYSDGVTPAEYYTYDTAPGWMSDLQNVVGRLANYSNASGGASAATFSYDAMGRVKRKWQQTPSSAPGGYFAYADYDLAGNTIALTYPDGRRVKQDFDNAGRLSGVSYDKWSGTSIGTTYLSGASYDPAGHFVGGTMGSRIQYTASYNNRLFLASSGYYVNNGGYLWTKGLSWQPNGNLDSETNWITGIKRQYGYDSLNRLVSATDVVGSVAAGNQTISTQQGTTNATSNNLLKDGPSPGSLWGKSQIGIADNAAAAPDGTQTASTATADSGATDALMTSDIVNPTEYSNSTLTGSVWLRTDSAPFTMRVHIVYNTPSGWGVAGWIPATVTNQWQQFKFSGSLPGELTRVFLQVGGAGSITSGQSFQIWGSRIEPSPSMNGTVTNFLTYSQRFTTTAWGQSQVTLSDNSADAPDGTHTAGTATVSAGATDALFDDHIPTPAPYSNIPVTGSIWMRVPSGTITFSIFMTETGASGWSVLAAKQVTLTTSWQRFQLTGNTQNALTMLNLQIGGAGTLTSGQFQIWGAQMEMGSTAHTYVATGNAAASTGTNFTNLLPYSNQFQASTWAKNQVTLSTASDAAPDGSMTATLLQGPSGSGDGYIAGNVQNLALYSGQTVTGSVYLRAVNGNPSIDVYMLHDGEAGWGGTSTTITLSQNWQRVQATLNVQQAPNRLYFQVGGSGKIANGLNIEVWGAQVEAAGNAGNYVATGATPVTNGSEYANILSNSQTLTGSTWGISQGTIQPTSATAPDNTNTAATVTSNSTANDTYVIDSVVNPSLYSGSTVTASVYLRVPSGSVSTRIYLINVGTSGWSIANSSLITLTTTWQRFTVTGTNQNGLTQLSLQIGGAGAFTNGQVLQVWGTQMVQGTDPGTYVATSSGSSTTTLGQPGALVPNGLFQTYAYDSFGNIKQSGNFTFWQTYLPNNRLSGYQYDAAGNLLADGISNIMTWDAENRIRSANGTTYVYDAEGNRVSKSGVGTTETVYFGGKPVARLQAGQWTDLIYGPAGLLAEVPGTQNGSPSYRLLDHLGTQVATTDASGILSSVTDSAPFGQIFTGGSNDPYKFTGKERDQESGLDYSTFRMYASTVGRWMSPDPYLGSIDLSNPQSLNRYAYVGNSPLTTIDPTGLDGVGAAGGAGGCLGAVVTGGANVGADASCVFGFLTHWLFSGPKFKGSLEPRPSNGNWDEQGAYHHSPYSSIASMIGDVGGLSAPGCDFGACGGGGFGFQQSGNYPNVGVNCRGIETYHLGAILAQHCDATVSIGDGWLYSLSAGPIDGRLRGFVTKTHTLPTGATNFWRGRESLGLAKCLIGAASASQASPDAPEYHPVYGPNSNIWLNGIFSSCGVNLGIKTHGPYF
ncbi:RHS repeat-associated core domain-containing protein [Terriglobus albidus]|uniref:RHS repeat-associated core domain-containing protein n=1 Tax=Terriglobus albidus TaxID=1592106 RepID=UPI0021E080E3|nr:RHS repeat-associated core domain-containing protein [Terriglobus albidus]